METKIRIGIIGTGSIADDQHAPAISNIKNAELVAVLSRDEKKGKSFLKKHLSRNGTVHTSLKSFSSDSNIDLVIICSPDKLHYTQALACLKSKKHVLIEKPFSTKIRDGIKLEKLANKNNLILKTGFHLRYHNGHSKLYDEIVNKKVLGKLRHIRILWAFHMKNNTNWRAKQEVGKWWSLSAIGAHCIDLTRWYGQDMNDWKQFNSTISTDIYKGPHDETAIISGEFKSGVTVEITSTIQFGPYAMLEIFGEKGYATCKDTLSRNGGGEIYINNKKLNFKTENPFKNQLSNIIKLINSNEKTSSESNSNSGSRSVKDLLKAYNV